MAKKAAIKMMVGSTWKAKEKPYLECSCAQLAEDEIGAGEGIAEQAIDGLSGHAQRAASVFEAAGRGRQTGSASPGR